MKFLVLIHVLSAIIGVGPTFFSHVLYRKSQTVNELRQSVKLAGWLEFFPKIGGTIAVLSGLLLIWIGEYGKITQLWLLGSIVLYVLIQIVVIAFATPPAKQLNKWLQDPANRSIQETLPEEPKKLLSKVNGLFYVASGMGTLLFIFMIVQS